MTDIIENNAISESVNLKLSLMDMFPVEFSQEEAEFAGAFFEDGISLDDVYAQTDDEDVESNV